MEMWILYTTVFVFRVSHQLLKQLFNIYTAVCFSHNGGASVEVAVDHCLSHPSKSRMSSILWWLNFSRFDSDWHTMEPHPLDVAAELFIYWRLIFSHDKCDVVQNNRSYNDWQSVLHSDPHAILQSWKAALEDPIGPFNAVSRCHVWGIISLLCNCHRIWHWCQ